MWQAGPCGTTPSSTVSPSQSRRAHSTSSTWPEVAPFSHSSPRERLQNVARRVASVRSRASAVCHATISTSPLAASWHTHATRPSAP